ncbi:hypothetical protein [Methanofollis formosanus]|nr:hypothetical protein [Methanofollis formosanus]
MLDVEIYKSADNGLRALHRSDNYSARSSQNTPAFPSLKMAMDDG